MSTAPLVFALLVATTTAQAADDSVCRPYAATLLNNQMQWLWSRSYSHCLLLEDDHPTPPARGDWRAALDILDPDRTPIIPLDRADVAHIGVVPATEKPPAPKQPPEQGPAVQAAEPQPPSPGSAAALAKCRSTHPAGFKASGTWGTYNVLVGKKWVRTSCPK